MSVSTSRSVEQLIDILRRSGPLPVGEERLARELRVCRATLLTKVYQLRQQGFRIQHHPRGGYRLLAEPDSLEPELVAPLLNTSPFVGAHYHYLPITDSTNRQASALAKGGAPEGTLVVADHQTGGRGRLGRNWHSPPGENLYCSLLLKPPLPQREAPQLTLLAGVAVISGLDRLFQPNPFTLKWPNDLLFQGLKVGGILTELVGGGGEHYQVVVGIGLNINSLPASFPPQLAATTSTLRQVKGHPLVRREVLTALVDSFAHWYQVLRQAGFAPLRAEWLARSGVVGQPVVITLVNERFHGVVEALDPQGQLVVRMPDGRLRTVTAGDVDPLPDAAAAP